MPTQAASDALRGRARTRGPYLDHRRASIPPTSAGGRACVRDFTPSFRNTLRRWYSTVLGLMEQLRRDLAIGVPAGDETGDLEPLAG